MWFTHIDSQINKLSRRPDSPDTLADAHLEELTITAKLGNTDLIITNVYIPPAIFCIGGYNLSLDHLMMMTDTLIRSEKTQHARGWTAAAICINCVHIIPAPRDGGPDSVFLASRPSLSTAWLALLLTKAWDVESNPGPTTHTNKDTPVIWICDICHKQINKKQPSIRCNHTHNTHWVHLKCTHIQHRQYKPDWRCTIHTPTQNVTTTPSTDNTTPHHKQTTTHSQTTINPRTKTSSYFKSTYTESETKLKKPSTQHPTGHHHNTRNKTHTES